MWLEQIVHILVKHKQKECSFMTVINIYWEIKILPSMKQKQTGQTS